MPSKINSATFRYMLSLTNFQTGIAVFAVPYVFQTVSLSVYTVLEVVILFVNIILIYNVIDYSDKQESIERTMALHNKPLSVLYTVFAFWVLLPLSPFTAISDMLSNIFPTIPVYLIEMLIATIVYILIHTNQRHLFWVLGHVTACFWLLLLFVVCEITQSSDRAQIAMIPQDPLESFQYSFLFFTTMFQTYAHDFRYLEEANGGINLKAAFCGAAVINAAITYTFSLVAIRFNAYETGNTLLLVKRSNFFIILEAIYMVQLVLISTLLVEKFEFFQGTMRCGKKRIIYRKHSQAVESTLVRTDMVKAEMGEAEGDVDPDLRELRPVQIAANEVVPLLVLIGVCLVNTLFLKSLALSINFCANFGSLFVYTTPGIVLARQSWLREWAKYVIITALVVWSAACSIVEVYLSVRSE